MAKNVMTQLIDHGKVRRGMLGVTIQPVTSDIARSLGLTRCAARWSTAVEAGSAAEKAGVRRGRRDHGGQRRGDQGHATICATTSPQLLPGSDREADRRCVTARSRRVNVTLSERKAANDAREEGADGQRKRRVRDGRRAADP